MEFVYVFITCGQGWSEVSGISLPETDFVLDVECGAISHKGRVVFGRVGEDCGFLLLFIQLFLDHEIWDGQKESKF